MTNPTIVQLGKRIIVLDNATATIEKMDGGITLIKFEGEISRTKMDEIIEMLVE